MTIDADLVAQIAGLQKARDTLAGCGAEAIGILRALDEAGDIPSVVRDQALDVTDPMAHGVGASEGSWRADTLRSPLE